jgi:hypothetical protein
MTPTPVFYEFLLRGDESGNLAGMHYQERAVYRDESGNKLFERLLDPQPVAAGSERVGKIIPALNAAALATIEAKDAQIAALTKQLDALPTPVSNRMRAWLAALPQEVRDGFAQAIQVLTPLIESGKYAEAALALEALTVPESLVTAKAEGLAILRGV